MMESAIEMSLDGWDEDMLYIFRCLAETNWKCRVENISKIHRRFKLFDNIERMTRKE